MMLFIHFLFSASFLLVFNCSLIPFLLLVFVTHDCLGQNDKASLKHYQSSIGPNTDMWVKDIVAPKNLEELKRIMQEAANQKVTIKALGVGGTYCGLSHTHGIVIETVPGLNKILDLELGTF